MVLTNAIPQTVLATRMPGAGEALVLLLILSSVVGALVAGLAVTIVGLVTASRGRPRSTPFLVKLGLIVFAAFPGSLLALFLFLILLG